MKNWRTTLGGVLGALGVALQNIDDPAWLGMLGNGLVMVALTYFGYQASDKSIPGEGTKG